MKTVHNERLKLSATFLNGVAIALFAIGALAPVVQAMRTMALPAGDWGRTLFVGVVCVGAAIILHFSARAILGGLKE